MQCCQSCISGSSRRVVNFRPRKITVCPRKKDGKVTSSTTLPAPMFFENSQPEFAARRASTRPPVLGQRLAERLEQRTVDRVLLRIVFGMPLHAECKARCVRDADRLDGAVLGNALDHHAPAGFEDA